MKFFRCSLLASTLLAASSLATTALAAGAADSITVVDPYVRQAPPGAPATGAFMVIRNSGSKEIKVIKADNPASKLTELHTHLNEGGMMKMRQVANIPVAAGGEAVLKPGGLHVMLIDLKTQLKDGDTVPITLSFDDGSSKKIDVPVKNPMAGGMPMKPDMPMHKH